MSLALPVDEALAKAPAPGKGAANPPTDVPF